MHKCIISHVAAMALGLYSHVFRFAGIILAVNLHGVRICLLCKYWVDHVVHRIAKINVGSC